MKKSLFLIAIFTFSLLTASSNFAQKAHRKDVKKHMPGIEKLNLTNAQQKKLDQLHYAQEEKAIDLRADMQKNRLEIKKLLSTPNFNQNDFLSLIKKASNLRSDLMESRVKTWLDVYNILDDKQKEEWADHFSHLANNFREKRFDGRKFDRHNMTDRFLKHHPELDKRQKIMDDKSN